MIQTLKNEKNSELLHLFLSIVVFFACILVLPLQTSIDKGIENQGLIMFSVIFSLMFTILSVIVYMAIFTTNTFMSNFEAKYIKPFMSKGLWFMSVHTIVGAVATYFLYHG